MWITSQLTGLKCMCHVCSHSWRLTRSCLRDAASSDVCTGGIHQRTASRWPWPCSVGRFLLCYVDTPFKKLVELTIWTKCAFPVLNSHTVWLPYIVGWGLGVSCVIVNDTYMYLWKFSIQMTVFSVTLYFIWGTLTSHTSTNRWCTTHMHIGLPYWHIWIPNVRWIGISLFTSHKSAVWNIVQPVSIQYERQTSIKSFNKTDF